MKKTRNNLVGKKRSKSKKEKSAFEGIAFSGWLADAGREEGDIVNRDYNNKMRELSKISPVKKGNSDGIFAFDAYETSTKNKKKKPRRR